jgi:hypothetical protein
LRYFVCSGQPDEGLNCVFLWIWLSCWMKILNDSLTREIAHHAQGVKLLDVELNCSLTLKVSCI